MGCRGNLRDSGLAQPATRRSRGRSWIFGTSGRSTRSALPLPAKEGGYSGGTAGDSGAAESIRERAWEFRPSDSACVQLGERYAATDFVPGADRGLLAGARESSPRIL